MTHTKQDQYNRLNKHFAINYRVTSGLEVFSIGFQLTLVLHENRTKWPGKYRNLYLL